MSTSPAHAREKPAGKLTTKLQTARRLALPALPVAFAAASQSAQAQIVYTDITDITIGDPNFTTQSIYLDLDRSGGGSVFASTNQAQVPGADFRFYFEFTQGTGKGGFYDPAVISLRQTSAQILTTFFSNNIYAFGADIPGAYANTFWTNSSLSPSAGSGYYALQIINGGNSYYGWARVTNTGRLGNLTLHDFAINSIPNEPITAGQMSAIPEPSTYAAVAGLLAGSAAMFRRRRRGLATAPAAARA